MTTPAEPPVVVEPSDAKIYRLLKAADRRPVTEPIAREAGELLGKIERRDTVDAVVAATAKSLEQRVFLLTSDPGDLMALTEDDDRVLVVSV